MVAIGTEKSKRLYSILFALAERYNPKILGTDVYQNIEEEFLHASFSYTQPLELPQGVASVRKGLSALDAAASNLDKRIKALSINESIWIASEPGCVHLLEKIVGDVTELSAVIKRMIKLSPQQSEQKVSNMPKHDYLSRLVNIYEQVTGKTAKRSYDDKKGQHTGPLFRFAWGCISTLEPNLKQSAVGDTLRRIIEARSTGNQ